jgi:hypothetical protein
MGAYGRMLTIRRDGLAAAVFLGDMSTKRVRPLSGTDAMLVAVEAGRSLRTVERYLDGKRMGSYATQAIERALRQLGLERALRAPVAS